MTPEDGANQNTDLPDLDNEPEPDDVNDETPDPEVQAERQDAGADKGTDAEAEGEEGEEGPKPFSARPNPRDSIAQRLAAQRRGEEGEDIEFSGDWADPVSTVGRYAPPKDASEDGEGDGTPAGAAPDAGEGDGTPAGSPPPGDEAAGGEQPTRTLKVNGQTITLTEEEIEAAASKNLAADDYLRQAREREKESREERNTLRQIAQRLARGEQVDVDAEAPARDRPGESDRRQQQDRPSQQPQRRDLTAEEKAKLAENILYGDPEQVFESIRSAVEAVVPASESQERLSEEDVRRVARDESIARQEFERARNEYDEFQRDNAELLESNNPAVSGAFQALWVREMQSEMQRAGFEPADIARNLGTDMERTYSTFMNMRKNPRAGIRRSVGETLNAAAEQVRPFLRGDAGAPRDQNANPTAKRQERARSTGQPPRRATQPPQSPAPPPPTQEESRRRGIEALRRGRGQLA